MMLGRSQAIRSLASVTPKTASVVVPQTASVVVPQARGDRQVLVVAAVREDRL